MGAAHYPMQRRWSKKTAIRVLELLVKLRIFTLYNYGNERITAALF